MLDIFDAGGRLDQGELEYEQSLLFGEVRRAIKRKKTEIKSKKKNNNDDN